MTVLAASPRAASLPADRARLLDANINPITGLATDYLNHFNEAIMMLELAPEMPDCMEDLSAWRPLSYCEHFATWRSPPINWPSRPCAGGSTSLPIA
jgi:hypothetical protein